jgi:RecB family exonuclease
MVIGRALSTQVKEDDIEQQRENNFHTRCQIQNKVYSKIIDSDSCANVASVNFG